MTSAHTGAFEHHDDDCRCVEADLYCNRDGQCWSCCGAAKEDSDCTAPEMHPTNPNHPLFARTVAGYRDVRPFYKSNEEIAALLQRWKTGRD